ncbi:MAG: Gfo/Idh/MocA family oxidoreductase [Filimonas sp.]|nr:Gfo/Idh/MocA family oxidoreductase [Filimonas sp.]
MNKKKWLIGVGGIGVEYAKVLKFLEIDFLAIGRGIESAKKFEEATGKQVISGGLASFLATCPKIPDAVIVAVDIESLYETAVDLLNYGVKKILLEKPGGCFPEQIFKLSELAKQKDATVLLGYNRRFYSSVLKAREIIAQDGGVVSFNFEFTEWAHSIEKLPRSKAVLENWLIANSSHVIDTAFFIGGLPEKLSAFYGGNLTWHPRSSVFAGAGISKKGAFFSYHANWKAPGRWGIEVSTEKHRLYFKPMESLQIQDLGSVAINPVELDNALDTQFKPGFFLQTKAFLNNNYTDFCDIEEQKQVLESCYIPMSGYHIEKH